MKAFKLVIAFLLSATVGTGSALADRGATADISSARFSPSLLDDAVFISELSVALYLLPALFAGIGINMVSHVLINHLVHAERAFDREHH